MVDCSRSPSLHWKNPSCVYLDVDLLSNLLSLSLTSEGCAEVGLETITSLLHDPLDKLLVKLFIVLGLNKAH